MKQEEYLKLIEEMDKAQEDTTPYAAVVNEEVVIEGDPNNTVVKKRDYTMRFIFPKEMAAAFPEAEDLKNGYIVAEIEYPDIFIDARNNLKYTSAMAQVIPFFRKLEESGDVEDLEQAEAIELFASLEDEIVDALYHLVEVVLGVDEKLAGYMAPGAVIYTASQIIRDFPSLANQGDLFFGLPTASR